MAGDLDRKIDKALDGDLLALGSLARLLDDGDPGAVERVYARLFPLGGNAHVVGVTGPPGAGKSTLVSRLISRGRAAGRKVCVLAVDPTSPFSGGAVLGDRIRMQEHAGDDGVFIRSLATRGHWGGLSRSVPSLLALFDGCGYGLILIETVGIGQDEVEVADLAHTCLLVTIPGMGDGIQAMKAGVLEVAHLYLVNKADLPGADRAAADLRAMLAMSEPRDGWVPPVLTAVAATGEGVEELFSRLTRHREHLATSPARERLALDRAEKELRSALKDALFSAIEELLSRERAGVEADIAAIARRELDPRTAARRRLR